MEPLAEDTRWLDATDTAALVSSGEVSASEMVDAAIERVEQLDPALNSVVLRWFEHARGVAEGELGTGPFRGVPFLLKDLWVQYAGQGRTDGNVALAASPPISTVDSVLVSRFKAAGLVTVGRSASPEMGTIPVTETAAHGPTRNPWDLERSPGGSSGGAAAAVAAGLVPIAHASDGGGSIRIPASACGLVGLKTSQGRITMEGHGIETSLGVDFCVSRTVRDSVAMLDAVHGPGVGDSIIAPPPSQSYASAMTIALGSLRIGLLDSSPMGEVHPDCVTAAANAAATLEALGHRVERAYPAPLDDASFAGRFAAMWAATRRTGLAKMEASIGRAITEDEVEPHNWAQAQMAEAMTAGQYGDALSAVAAFRREVQQWWADGWDLLLTPTLAEPPPRIGELVSTTEAPFAGMARAAEIVPFTPAFNATGQPAISLPLHWNDDGLPIGVQLVAAYGAEDLLLRVAAQLEEAMPWGSRRPPV